jgi:hypothetical protein
MMMMVMKSKEAEVCVERKLHENEKNIYTKMWLEYLEIFCF